MTMQGRGLRERWPYEEEDFHPWLERHIPDLGHALDIALDFRSRGDPAGSFEVDFLGRDKSHDCDAVIETQLDISDHDHLGKLMTYSVMLRCGTLIWVAAGFRREHLQVLDWLNQTSSPHLHVWGVVVALPQEEGGPVRDYFRVEVGPGHPPRPSPQPIPSAQSARTIFLDAIDDEIRTQHGFSPTGPRNPEGWRGYRSAFRGVRYGVALVRESIRIDLVTQTRDNLWVFDALKGMQPQIEAEMGEPLEWAPPGGRSRWSIAVQADNSPGEVSTRDVHAWAVAHLVLFRRVFDARLAALTRRMTGQETPK